MFTAINLIERDDVSVGVLLNCAVITWLFLVMTSLGSIAISDLGRMHHACGKRRHLSVNIQTTVGRETDGGLRHRSILAFN
jgi:hypothetical protein